MAGNEAITNDTVGYAQVENFALKVFVNADNEDRAGKANKFVHVVIAHVIHAGYQGDDPQVFSSLHLS